MKSRKNNKTEYYAFLLQISKRLYQLKLNSDHEISFLPSIFKVVQDEINDNEDFWEVRLCETRE